MSEDIENVVDSHERIVKITETWEDETRVFYAIRDHNLGYWRGKGALDEFNAWTRELSDRAEYSTRKEAQSELVAIWDSRGYLDSDDSIFDEIPYENEAA